MSADLISNSLLTAQNRGFPAERRYFAPITCERVVDLEHGFQAHMNVSDSRVWTEALSRFDDANIYHVWDYENVCHPNSHIGRIMVTRDALPVGMAQARIMSVPMVGRGIAFMRLGPLWKVRGEPVSQIHLTKCLKAVFNEFAVRRRLLVRIIPRLFAEDEAWALPIFEQQGFSRRSVAKPRRTIIMNLKPSMEEIHVNLHVQWRKHLKSARKKNQRVLEGEGDELFAAFEEIYSGMRKRKSFTTFTDFDAFRRLQARVSPKEKMTVILCGEDSEFYSGAIVSSLGNMALYLFGATDGRGLENNGSYQVQWRAIELLKERGCEEYDLNGINPEENPSTYEYKSRLGGKDRREVQELGIFEACGDRFSQIVARVAMRGLDFWRDLKQRRGRAGAVAQSPKETKPK